MRLAASLVVLLAACRTSPEPRHAPPGTAESELWKERFRATRIEVVAAARANPHRVLYRSNESGAWQLHVWDRATGERRQLTFDPLGERSGALTADGGAAVYLRDTGGSEVGAYVKTPFTGGESAPLAPDLPADLGPGGVDFAPDGQAAYVGGSHREGYRIWRVVPRRGEPARLLYRHPNEAYAPHVSADGALLAFIHSERKPDRHWTVRVVRAATGDPVADLTDGPAFTVTHAAWSPEKGDERLLVNSNASGELRPSIWEPPEGARRALKLETLRGDVEGMGFLTAQELLLVQRHEGVSRVWLYSLRDEALSAVPLEAGTVGAAATLGDGTALFNWSSGVEPPRVLHLSGLRVDPVLEPPREHRPPPGHALKPVWFTSADGTRVQGFLAEPPGPRPRPAVVYVLGGPGNQFTDQYHPTVAAMVDHGYAVLAVNYRGSEGYGHVFRHAIEGDPGRLELEDIAAGRRFLVEQGIARADRIALRGPSYGGYLTLMALTHQTGWWLGYAFVGIADFRLMYEDAREALRGYLRRYLGGAPDEKPELYAERSPLTHAASLSAPLLVMHGRNDSRAPLRQMQAFLARLDELRKPYQAMLFEGGHGTLRADQQIAIEERFFAFCRERL